MKELPAGTIKRIHVDRRILAKNLKTGQNRPAITIQTSKGAIKAKVALVRGEAVVVQAGWGHMKPLKCGARVWVQTRATVEYQ